MPGFKSSSITCSRAVGKFLSDTGFRFFICRLETILSRFARWVELENKMFFSRMVERVVGIVRLGDVHVRK